MAVLAQLMDDVVVGKFDLSRPAITIGRHPDNDIIIDDLSVSGHHAVIEVRASQYMDAAWDIFIIDCGSKNGTFVNERQVLERQQLLDGDVLKFAWNQFKFIDGNQQPLAQTAHILQ